MADNKRYFNKGYGDECYFFDSEVISEKEFEEKLDYVGYRAFEDSLTRDEILKLLNENNELKSKVNDTQVAVEIATEETMQRVFDLIDIRIKIHEHKPLSALVSNPANPNYDPDVDRLARLYELQQLRKELEE